MALKNIENLSYNFFSNHTLLFVSVAKQISKSKFLYNFLKVFDLEKKSKNKIWLTKMKQRKLLCILRSNLYIFVYTNIISAKSKVVLGSFFKRIDRNIKLLPLSLFLRN